MAKFLPAYIKHRIFDDNGLFIEIESSTSGEKVQFPLTIESSEADYRVGAYTASSGKKALVKIPTTMVIEKAPRAEKKVEEIVDISDLAMNARRQFDTPATLVERKLPSNVAYTITKDTTGGTIELTDPTTGKKSTYPLQRSDDYDLYFVKGPFRIWVESPDDGRASTNEEPTTIWLPETHDYRISESNAKGVSYVIAIKKANGAFAKFELCQESNSMDVFYYMDRRKKVMVHWFI